MSETKKFRCCICGREVSEHGNDPYPIKEDGQCCNHCNWTVVLKERIRLSDEYHKRHGTDN